MPQAAIFCDGWRFHASGLHNNLAEDARKRAELRELGYVVLSLSWADLEGTEPVDPTWYDARVAPQLVAQASISLKPGLIDLIRRGPIDQLISWIQSPDPEGLTNVGRALPYFFAPVAQARGLSGQRVDLAVSAVDVLEGFPLAGAGVPVWAWRHDTLVVMCRLNPQTNATEIAVVLDDHPESVGLEQKVAWQTWLRIGNLLALREVGTQITVRSRAGTAEALPASEAGPQSTAAGLSPAWQALAESATGAERAFIEILADAGVAPPELGHEIDGLPLGPSWPDIRVTVDLDLEADERAELEALGWEVVAMDVDSIQSALTQGGV